MQVSVSATGVCAKPNVRATRVTTAARQAQAGKNVHRTADPDWWPAVGAPLERGARPHRWTWPAKRCEETHTPMLPA